MSPLASLIRASREKAGLTLREAAEKSELTAGYLSLLESGEKQAPSPEVVARIAKALSVTLEELLIAAGHVPTDLLAVLSQPGVAGKVRKMKRVA